MKLNEDQALLATTHEGPIIVHARPGSGKTTGIINNLMDKFGTHRIDPRRVLVTTFSKEASKSIVSRIRAFLGTASGYTAIGTSHSLFYRLLHGYGVFPSLQHALIKEWVARSYIYDIIPRKFLIPGEENTYLNKIGFMKSNLCWPNGEKGPIPLANWEKMKVSLAADQIDWRFFEAIWLNYENKKRLNGQVDFDDILLEAYVYYLNTPKALLAVQEFFDYIIVDEFQDTNIAQYELFRLLAGLKQNIMVVGDECQSIYGFRAAYPECMEQFKLDFPQHRVIEFRTNYRSNPQISAAANTLIKQNKQISNTDIISVRGNGARPVIAQLNSFFEEAEFIARCISSSAYNFDQIAILTRYNEQQCYLERSLIEANIPYEIVDNDKFYNRPEIQAALLYLELLTTDKVAKEDDYMRIIRELYNKPIQAKRTDVDQWKTLSAFRLNKAGGEFNNRLKKLEAIYDNSGGDAEAVIEGIMSDPINLARYSVEKSHLQDMGGLATLFLTSFKEYSKGKTVEEVIETAHNIQDSYEQQTKDVGPKVKISTIHKAKGLEWSEVYVPGLNEGLFPREDAKTNRDEERRIFYVAITRPKDVLVVTCTNKSEPSSFLKEIQAECDCITTVEHPGAGIDWRRIALPQTEQTPTDKPSILEMGYPDDKAERQCQTYLERDT